MARLPSRAALPHSEVLGPWHRPPPCFSTFMTARGRGPDEPRAPRHQPASLSECPVVILGHHLERLRPLIPVAGAAAVGVRVSTTRRRRVGVRKLRCRDSRPHTRHDRFEAVDGEVDDVHRLEVEATLDVGG